MPDVGGPGIDTERETICRRAPSNENDIEAYIGSVAKILGVQPSQLTTLRGLVVAIIRHENGCVPY